MRKLRYANFTHTSIITKHSIAKQSPSFINRQEDANISPARDKLREN